MGKCWHYCPRGCAARATRRLLGVIEAPGVQVAFSCVRPERATERIFHQGPPIRSTCQRAILLFEETSRSQASMQVWFAARHCRSLSFSRTSVIPEVASLCDAAVPL